VGEGEQEASGGLQQGGFSKATVINDTNVSQLLTLQQQIKHEQKQTTQARDEKDVLEKRVQTLYYKEREGEEE